jgi:peptidoglycan/xylan/chitin deacetylase (PgdA/CDA1 family)
MKWAERYTGFMKFALPLLAFLALIACGVSRLAAQQAHLQVAFTFDDLPAHGPLPPGEFRPEPIRTIIKTLKTENMPPTYGFVNGFRTDEYPYQSELLREWLVSGNPLGSHTWSHPSLDKSSAKKYIANIAENEPLLEKIDPLGDWHWFRFPYLEEGDTLAKRNAVRDYLLGHHYKIAEVTLDFGDYMWNDAYARCAAKHDDAAVVSLQDSYLATADEYITYSRTLSQRLYGRDIPYVLLLHVGAFDAKMLPQLIALFRKRGFEFVSLPQAESDPAYSVDPKIAYPGGGLLMELAATTRNVNLPNATEPEAQLEAMCR